MRVKNIVRFIFINSLYALSLTYVLFQHVFTGRINVNSFIYALFFGLISTLYGYLAENLKQAFLGYVASVAASIFITIILVRYPIEAFIGSLAAELVTIFVLRNTVTYIAFIIFPVSVIFIPLGIYLSQR
ncbi:MAG: hypothetical protein DRJ32_04295 [Thermoprotei archaeon]|nr:MAG: hypothetical protein DRJ32_04295 [Thermoprotei archaeon]